MSIPFSQLNNQILERKDDYKKVRSYKRLTPRLRKEVDKVMNFSTNRKGDVDVPKLMSVIDKSPARRQLEKIIDEALVGEEENIAKFQGGSDRVLGYFVGKCLKSTKGKGNPKLINKILLEKLKK